VLIDVSICAAAVVRVARGAAISSIPELAVQKELLGSVAVCVDWIQL
jgi:hypothetical protein